MAFVAAFVRLSKHLDIGNKESLCLLIVLFKLGRFCENGFDIRLLISINKCVASIGNIKRDLQFFLVACL